MKKKDGQLVPQGYTIVKSLSKKQQVTSLTRNPLLNFADRIFASINQLKNYQTEKHIKDFFLKELEDFNQKANEAGYSENQIIIADYALRSYLDERLKINTKNKFNFNKSLITKNHNNYHHFFILLEKISKKPDQFIDVIEFMYVILNLGFRGKFRSNIADRKRLQKIIDQTYAVIRQERGEFSRQFFTQENTENHVTSQNLSYLSTWVFIILSLIIVAGIYLGFNTALKIFSAPLNQQFQSIKQG